MFDEDLDAEFSATDPFCVAGTFTIGGDEVTVYGHFIEATEAVSVYSGELEANDASFEVKTSDVANVKNDMTVVIDGTTYTVKRKQKLGTGISLLYLKT
jgi:hypothetical protein